MVLPWVSPMYTGSIHVNELLFGFLINLLSQCCRPRTQKSRRKIISPPVQFHRSILFTVGGDYTKTGEVLRANLDPGYHQSQGTSSTRRPGSDKYWRYQEVVGNSGDCSQNTNHKNLGMLVKGFLIKMSEICFYESEIVF